MATCALYRILSNDLWPRHARGQTLANLRFLLEHEPPLPGCEKRWVVNRILVPRAEERLIALLERARQPYLRIPFRAEEYAAAARRREPPADYPLASELSSAEQLAHHHKCLYALNLNGARNAALREGRQLAEWVLPFDGACAFDARGFDQLRARLEERQRSAFAVPMYRLTHDRDYLRLGPAQLEEDEPQVALRHDAPIEFHEGYRYGRLNKLELLNRLELVRPGSLLASDAARAGYVLRLSSGRARADLSWLVALRKHATRLHLLRTDLAWLGAAGLVRDRLARRLRRS